MSSDQTDSAPLLELFRDEVEAQTHVLTSGMLALERDPRAADQLEACMRAAHSLKGAARMVGVDAGVRIAHAMEDCFVAAQHGLVVLVPAHIDALIDAADLLSRIARTPPDEIEVWENGGRTEVDGAIQRLARVTSTEDASTLPPATPSAATRPVEPPPSQPPPLVTLPAPAPPRARPREEPGAEASDRALRVTAESLNRLIALAGESLVESRWLRPFTQSLTKAKRLNQDAGQAFDRLRDTLAARGLDDDVHALVADARSLVLESQQWLSQRLAELETFDHRSASLSQRLYEEALTCRMRPFADGVQAYPRLVRDAARLLGKNVRLDIVGETTQVDREILGKLDAPLGHLLRNAIDHGLETPDERRSAGKPVEGVVRLEARHRAGALHITISDDGRGVDLEKLRQAVVDRGLVTQENAGGLSEVELLEFLFLPGFSLKGQVTELSGRGVGLDAVQEMVRQVRGTVRISSELGAGTRFHLQLPVTLSVVRTLLAEIGGEPYAFPLASIVRMVSLPVGAIDQLEGRQHFAFDGRRIGLVAAHDVLGTRPSDFGERELSVVVIGDATHTYGLAVDRFIGERELVVQPLDAALGKIKDIAAGALMPDGSPVLIIDAEDLIRSVDKLASDGRLGPTTHRAAARQAPRKRVLVVDDSLTVREVERKLLAGAGYEVEVAVDGMDGWNAIRTGAFDLIITDIDMPRMNGFELVARVRQDAKLRSTPVVVVSYKDREDDRQRGLDAGAARYLTKGSFHDDTLVQTVVDLIGEAVE